MVKLILPTIFKAIFLKTHWKVKILILNENSVKNSRSIIKNLIS